MEKSQFRERIFWKQRIPHCELAKYYATSDLFIFPSRWEVFGMVLLEALACGVPVVTTPVGGATMLAEKNCAVSFFPIGDDKALAAQMQKENSLEVRLFARTLAEEYSWQNLAKLMIRNFPTR